MNCHLNVQQTLPQTPATAPANLRTNSFIKSGYTFIGWNTAADGSGTSYADAASYPFDGSSTLYAQWGHSLASTGVDAADTYLTVATGLSLVGIGAFGVAMRRRRWGSV